MLRPRYNRINKNNRPLEIQNETTNTVLKIRSTKQSKMKRNRKKTETNGEKSKTTRVHVMHLHRDAPRPSVCVFVESFKNAQSKTIILNQ